MAYKYIGVPKSITFHECEKNNYVFAPSKYSRFLPDDNTLYIKLSSVCKESKKKIRPDRKKQYAYSEIGDINVNSGSVESNFFYGFNLPSDSPKQCQKGDILVSTVRTYRGGIGIITDDFDNNCCSPAILIIRDIIDRRITKEYLYAVLRTDFFIEQILGFQNRGMYPRLDSNAMDNVIIPIPSDNQIIDYISMLAKAYIKKYSRIKKKHKEIISKIEEELRNNQKNSSFSFNLPRYNDIQNFGRLDTGLYNEDFSYWNWMVKNYVNGSKNLIERGFTYSRGTSLEKNFIKTRIDSEVYIKGFYELVLPTNIHQYGYVEKSTFIGTPTKLKTIEKGDIIFGGEGFGKGRTFVVVDESHNVATNYHGIRIINKKKDLVESLFIRCFLAFWREKGMIDHIGVGGSGGHCAPSYFHMIETPLFPESVQKEIASLYYNSQNYDTLDFNITNYIEKDEIFNERAGIFELNKAANNIKILLDKAIDDIVNNRRVDITFKI